MKKIPCLFIRDFADPRCPAITRAVEPTCDWVIDGEGVPTRKHDGTACMVDDGGRLWARYMLRPGKVPPDTFMPAGALDHLTRKQVGWVRVDDGAQWKHHRKPPMPIPPGTYELVGPKINGNHECLTQVAFVRHGSVRLEGVPRDLEGLRSYLETFPGEGIVFHNRNGAMAKIRRDDFGFAWPIPEKSGGR